jgi:hypothetical protein
LCLRHIGLVPGSQYCRLKTSHAKNCGIEGL